MKSRPFSILLIISLITSLAASEIEPSIRITSIVNNSGRLQISWRGGRANKRYELEFCEDSHLNEWKSALAWTQDGNSSNNIYLDDFPDQGFLKIVELPPISPNILLVYLDDASVDMVPGVNHTLQIPNLDSLASRGVVFENAYCPLSLCNPSRVSLLSGLHPSTTGIFQNEQHVRSTSISNVPFMPYYFRQQGYRTGGAGKIWHGNYVQPDCWDEYYNRGTDNHIPSPSNPVPADSWKVLHWGVYENGPNGELGKTVDTYTTDFGIDMIERFDEPFFIGVGYFQNHLPWIIPSRFSNLYDPMVDVPPLPSGESSNWREDVSWYACESYSYVDPTVGSNDEERRRLATVAYWSTMTFVDHEIGRLIEALHRSGKAENTIIVVVSDHGWSNGLHARYGKQALFDPEAKAPFMISVPWIQSTHSERIETPVGQVDLYPTLIDYCGFPEIETHDGTSLRPLIEGGAEYDRPVFTFHKRWNKDVYGIMTRYQNFKYVHWASSKCQLYDLSTDPGEYVNLFFDPEYSDVIDRFHLLQEPVLSQLALLNKPDARYSERIPGR